ncbi:MAG: hypothetical protein ABJF04_02055 [Reichenbachiella sp.]|uniref:hypothetical protein n=1 Tax=Reichenbachiella sp. TaxID=2184521 RepID=UPI003263AE13
MSNKDLPKMMHSTYFTLAMGSTPANRESFIESCAAYLSKSKGMLSFWVAELAEDVFRLENDRDFNISMNQVFENQAAFDLYNSNDTSHKQFVTEVNRWAASTGRRVLDSYLSDLIASDGRHIPASNESPRMVHSIYFSLTDNSAESIDQFTELCLKYLSNHKGVCTFAIGGVANLHRDVSITNYDVAMNILWQSKDSYSEYLKSQEHDDFLMASQGMISNTQVFDSYVHETPMANPLTHN